MDLPGIILGSMILITSLVVGSMMIYGCCLMKKSKKKKKVIFPFFTARCQRPFPPSGSKQDAAAWYIRGVRSSCSAASLVRAGASCRLPISRFNPAHVSERPSGRL